MNLFHKRSTLYFLLSGTVTMIFIMIITGRPLTTEATPSGIINLELAYTHTKVQAVLSAWNNDIIAQLKPILTSIFYSSFSMLFSYTVAVFNWQRFYPRKKVFQNG